MEEKIGMTYRPSKLASVRHVIYGLTDSADDVVRYVGRTCLAQIRLDQHYQAALAAKENLATYKDQWIVSLVSEGRYPKMVILDVVNREDAADAEKTWIAKYPAGQVFNNQARWQGRSGERVYRAKPKDLAAQTAKLKAFMGKHKLNQAQTAERLGVHFSTVSRWMDGTRAIRKQTMALLEALK